METQDTQEQDQGDTTDAKGFLAVLSKFLKRNSERPEPYNVNDMYNDEVTAEIENAYKRQPKFSKAEMLSDVYMMNFHRRGNAVIVNNKTFSKKLQEAGFGERTGTDIDATSISKRLQLLGFKVDMHRNITADKIMEVFRKVSVEDHSDADCFVGVLLSHGENDKVYGTDKCLQLKDIFNMFNGNNCHSLVGKPKIFFIQACRGVMLDKGAYLNVADAKRDSDEPLPQTSQTVIKIPTEADFLISYSTVPGYFSWRNSARGSWYSQALVTALDEGGTTMEILKLLTFVNRLVAYSDKFMSNTQPAQPEMHGMKQVSSFTSMLTKDLYFTPKK